MCWRRTQCGCLAIFLCSVKLNMVMCHGRKKLWCAVSCLVQSMMLLVQGCSQQSTSPLAAFSPQKVFYSYSLTSSPPSGLGVKFTFLDIDVDCEDIPHLESPPETLLIHISGFSDGDYVIRSEGIEESNQDVFEAGVTHRFGVDGGYFKYSIPYGVVTVTGVDGVWPYEGQSGSVSGTATLYGAIVPFQAGECLSGSDGAFSCKCTDVNGDIVFCTPEGGSHDCCPTAAEQYVVTEVDFEAEFCPILCEATSPSLVKEYCEYASR